MVIGFSTATKISHEKTSNCHLISMIHEEEMEMKDLLLKI
ncbi:hypothetical protein VQL36_04025 [Chengkuizengella sp. SCS-71B]